MSLIVTFALVTAALAPLGSVTAPTGCVLPQEPPQDAAGEAPPPSLEPPPLCPEPLLFEPRWSPLALGAEGRVVYSEAGLEPLAEVLAADLGAVTGLVLPVAGIPARSGDIVLTLGYLPEDLRENPEAFFIEVFDHVVISGETVDGLARGTARFLQLATPMQGESEALAVAVPPVRIVDAPSVRWRALAVDAEDLVDGLFPEAEPAATGPLDHVVARAHLAGFNALVFRDRRGAPSGAEFVKMAARHLEREAARRRVTLVLDVLDERPTALRGGVGAAGVPDFTRKELSSLAARLERGESVLLCERSPLLGPLPPTALGSDEHTTARRLGRFMYPIPPIGRAEGAAPLLGVLYGARRSLTDDVALPLGWSSKAALAPEDALPPLAGEAWHGGMRVDTLRGAGELARVLERVTAALTRRG